MLSASSMTTKGTIGIGALALAAALLAVPPGASAQSRHHARRCFGHRPTLVVRGRHARGTSRADVILVVNRKGAKVRAGRGKDFICGGPGRDVLLGGGGGDRMAGGRGNDVLNAGQGRRDVLLGGAGHDRFITRHSGHARTDADAGEVVNGRRKVVRSVKRRSTSTPPSRRVLKVTGNPANSEVVVLASGVSVPHVGGTLVLPPSRKALHGVLGVVTAVAHRRGRTVVRTRPGTLQDAYKSFHAHLQGSLAQLTTPSYQRASTSVSLGGFAPKFSCKGPALKHSVATRVDLTEVNLIFDVTDNPSINFLLTGQPKFHLDFDFSGKVTCTALHQVPIPVGNTGIVIKVGPKFSFEASGKIGAHFTWDPRIAYGFYRSRSSGNADFHVFKNQGSVDFDGRAGITVGLGLKTDVTLAGRVGVAGTIGPELIGEAEAESASAQACYDIRADMAAELEAYADVFFKTWTFHIASGHFGRVQLAHSCSGGSGGGGGESNGGGDSGGPSAPTGGGSGASDGGPLEAVPSVVAGGQNFELRGGQCPSGTSGVAEYYVPRGAPAEDVEDEYHTYGVTYGTSQHYPYGYAPIWPSGSYDVVIQCLDWLTETVLAEFRVGITINEPGREVTLTPTIVPTSGAVTISPEAPCTWTPGGTIFVWYNGPWANNTKPFEVGSVDSECRWSPIEITLPADLPPGEYSVEVGVAGTDWHTFGYRPAPLLVTGS